MPSMLFAPGNQVRRGRPRKQGDHRSQADTRQEAQVDHRRVGASVQAPIDRPSSTKQNRSAAAAARAAAMETPPFVKMCALRVNTQRVMSQGPWVSTLLLSTRNYSACGEKTSSFIQVQYCSLSLSSTCAALERCTSRSHFPASSISVTVFAQSTK